jgi:hypothetical protein
MIPYRPAPVAGDGAAIGDAGIRSVASGDDFDVERKEVDIRQEVCCFGECLNVKIPL